GRAEAGLGAGGDEDRAGRGRRPDARDGARQPPQHPGRGAAGLRPETTSFHHAHRCADRRPIMTHAELPRGMDLLNCQGLNKGTAFTDAERAALGLQGLLPPHVETLAEQSVRAYEAYQHKSDDLERHIYLRALQDTNEVLFYRL